ncbi:MAG: hypothetical protein GXY83_18615 [Rhodopirellula sp.]|nr:hypothetical protein [Rhodopirellula sp.]
MVAFRQWLIFEERRLIDPAVLSQFERAFEQALDGMIHRTRDPALRRTLEGMRGCPVHDASGGCHSWTDYIVGAMVRHNCHRVADPDETFARVAFNMLSRVGERGGPRKSIFDFDESRPFDLNRGNPIEVLFKTYLANTLRNICSGRMPSLKTINRPAGTVSIAHGQRKHLTPGEVPADEIPDRTNAHESELFRDLRDVLRRNSTRATPLADLWQAMLDGATVGEQRRRFGPRVDAMRTAIKDAVKDYATETGNHELLRLLTTKPKPRTKPAPKPKLPPDVQDVVSIMRAVGDAGGAISLSDLMRKRRKWTDLPPRNPTSQQRSRLHDVLSRMLDAGVLAQRDRKYVPGQNWQAYRDQAEGKAAVAKAG